MRISEDYAGYGKRAANVSINQGLLEEAKALDINLSATLEKALDEAVPKGCGLIDVQVENGVAKLNFTKEFMQIVNNIDGGRLALKALVAGTLGTLLTGAVIGILVRP